LNRLWNGSNTPNGMSPIGWMMLGGILALTLAPTVKKAMQEKEITNKGVKKVTSASNMVLGNVKKNLKNLVGKTDVISEVDNLTGLKNKIRVRKRNMVVGASKI